MNANSEAEDDPLPVETGPLGSITTRQQAQKNTSKLTSAVLKKLRFEMMEWPKRGLQT